MKHFTLFLLTLFLITTTVSAQTHQFGFVVKVGNAARPVRNEQVERFAGGYYQSKTLTTPGSVTVFGIANRFKINKRLHLTSEVLFRYAAASRGIKTNYVANGIISESNQSDRISESSISAPVKLEWTPFKKQRTSLGFGIGASRTIGAGAQTKVSNSINGNPGFNFEYVYPKAELDASLFSMEMSLVAGIYHRFSQQTSIGLEMTAEPQRDQLYALVPQPFLADCLCYGYPQIESIKLLSFTLSVRHFLQKLP